MSTTINNNVCATLSTIDALLEEATNNETPRQPREVDEASTNEFAFPMSEALAV